MNYYKLHTKNFLKKVKSQDLDENIIIDALDKCYQNTAFSTFPYIMHNMNSKQAIEKFNSGNCIALSMYIQQHLLEKYQIQSFLIPATIPDKYKFSTYLDICHVALAIPKNRKEIFIADPAFYFLNPIKINTESDSIPIVFSKDIYQYEPSRDLRDYISIEKIQSQLIKSEVSQVLNKYQTIPKNTFVCQCNYLSDSFDTWSYILREVTNPDRAISTFFINTRKIPFICSTKMDHNGVCVNDTYLKLMDNNNFKLSFESKPGINYNVNNLSQQSINKIDKKLVKHLQGNLRKYLSEQNLENREYIFND
jgi:hypothetical protein